MLKFILTAMIVLLPMSRAATLMAADEPPHEVFLKKERKDIVKELEYKIKTHAAFLRATAMIVEETKNSIALSFVRMAEASAREAMVHYNSGDYEFSLEDFSESTQRAIHAITIAKNPHDKSVREFAIQEELIQSERKDKERKVYLIDKGMNEVSTFIKTADRLVAENMNESAAKKLEEVRALYESSKKALSEDRLDNSLDDIQGAYKLVTNTVKEIKSSQQDIITFPKPSGTQGRDLLNYELKRNDAYFYFASQVVRQTDKKASDMLKAGKEAKADAEGMVKDGETKKAITRLKESTELFIKAVKSPSAE